MLLKRIESYLLLLLVYFEVILFKCIAYFIKSFFEFQSNFSTKYKQLLVTINIILIIKGYNRYFLKLFAKNHQCKYQNIFQTSIIAARKTFLKYFFTSYEGYNSLVSRSSGSVQVNISKRAVIEEIPIKLPPLSDQEKIVHYLKIIDKKI